MNRYDAHSDEQLLVLLKTSEREAFVAIYNRYWKPLYDRAYRRLADRDQTEDVLQDVFARLWTRREALAIEQLGAYLASAVRYEVLRYLTRNKTALHFYQPFEDMLQEMESPDTRLITRDLLALVYSYAGTLPEKRKRIFLLHIERKLSTREIAESLGVSQKTVQNQLGTALQGLKTHLAPILAAIIASRF
jgi:RNA polymerase sigma-70 factor (family 1)